MEQTLRQHISFLEERVKGLRNQLSNPSRIAAELEGFRADLQIAELALSHYRKALDLERQTCLTRCAAASRWPAPRNTLAPSRLSLKKKSVQRTLLLRLGERRPKKGGVLSGVGLIACNCIL
jgi:hypothetical protein